MSELRQAIDDAGGVAPVASACGISLRAIYKWLSSDSFPRTEYTGETDYADRIARLAAERGNHLDAAALRASAAPKRSAA